MEKIFSKHLEMAYQEFLQAPEARESPIPSCRCAKCAKRNLPNHFLISWQMSLQISLQAARSVLNQIFISRSLAQHRFGVEKQDIFKYLENSINIETGIEMEIKRTGHEIQMGFNERVCSPEEFRVVFVIVNDPEDLSYFQEQKRISVWASLSYCPYSDSFLLNDKPHSQTSPDAKPRLDGKLWNPTRKLDFKQLLFLTELSCVMGEEINSKNRADERLHSARLLLQRRPAHLLSSDDSVRLRPREPATSDQQAAPAPNLKSTHLDSLLLRRRGSQPALDRTKPKPPTHHSFLPAQRNPATFYR